MVNQVTGFRALQSCTDDETIANRSIVEANAVAIIFSKQWPPTVLGLPTSPIAPRVRMIKEK